MELFYLRAAERLLIVFSGLICIVLGYGLFRLSYLKADAPSVPTSAEMVAKGAGFELTLKHVWPGVFFAAFGMMILITSILTQLKSSASGSGGSDGSKQFTYQGGGSIPTDSKTRASSAIAAIGGVLAIEPPNVAASNPQRANAISRLGTAQIDLVDLAYGQGSYTRFTDIASKSQTPAKFDALSAEDKQFFEDLRTALQR